MNEFLSQLIFKEEAEQEMFVQQKKLLIKQRHKNTSPLQKTTKINQRNKKLPKTWSKCKHSRAYQELQLPQLFSQNINNAL